MSNTKPVRTSNGKARQYVQSRTPFVGSNLFAENTRNSYVVYSYGTHAPLYVYNFKLNRWYANLDKFSNTTTRQAGQTHPLTQCLLYGTTQALNKIIHNDDDSGTFTAEAIPRPVPTRPRNPERETVRVLKSYGALNFEWEKIWGRYREHYVDTLPKPLQHSLAILKLTPLNTYIEGIGARTERGFILLVKP